MQAAPDAGFNYGGVVLQEGLLIDNGFMQSCVSGLSPLSVLYHRCDLQALFENPAHAPGVCGSVWDVAIGARGGEFHE